MLVCIRPKPPIIAVPVSIPELFHPCALTLAHRTRAAPKAYAGRGLAGRFEMAAA